MKITLAVLAIIVLASAGAWFYYLNNEEFQAAELTTIKRTTGSLATSLKENQQQATQRRAVAAPPTQEPWGLPEPPPAEPEELPPTPNIEATVQAQINEFIRRIDNTIAAPVIPPIPTPSPTATPTAMLPTPTPTIHQAVMKPSDPAGTLILVPSGTPGGAPPRITQLTAPPPAAPRPTMRPVITASKVARTIKTGMGKTVDVTVEGFTDSPAMFNTLIQIIDEEERMLGVPYPSPKVKMQKVNRLPPAQCGHNQSSYLSRYQGEPYRIKDSVIRLRIDEDCNDTFGTIAHEVAHTWFSGNDPQEWIDEGLANSVEIQMKEAHPEEGLNYLPRTYCATYRNIAGLEAAKPISDASTPASGFRCNYTLGDGIFGALREHLGTETFNQAIQELGKRDVNPSNRANNVEDVKRVLGLDARALEIINLWYSGAPEMRIYRHLDLVEYTHPPTLDGKHLHFAGRIKEPGLVHEPIPGRDNYCSQFHLYQGLTDPMPLTGPTDPLYVGWTHHEVPDAAIINSEINPATGEFSVTARVNTPHLLSRKDLSLQVASRVSARQDGKCQEAISYSHVPVESGVIPNHLKKTKHYHENQIAWDWTPQVSNYQVHLSGKAPPGSLFFRTRDNYCGQIDLYRVDEGGYHRISGINSMLPNGQQWTTTPRAEITSGRVGSDGRFEATIQIWDASLLNYPHVVLEIKAKARIDALTNRCAPSDTMSAVSLIGN